MLFVLDNDIDAAVGRMLRREAHRCVMVGQIGLGPAGDDDVSVFADNHGGTFVTHDRELIQRRRRNTFGRHVHLDCHEWDAAAILKGHLAATIELLLSRDAIVIRVTREGPRAYKSRWI